MERPGEAGGTAVPPAIRRLEEQVLLAAGRRRLLEAGQRVLVAVSGGRDSMVLLDVLDRLRPVLGLAALGVAHVDHGLRPDSAGDARWVEEQAAARGLPFLCRRVHIRPGRRSLEEGARLARYRALAAMARQFGAQRVALAHHAGDQAETVLMRLLAGAGVRGLAGMPWRRGPFVRPLLATEPALLAAYAAARGLGWRDDPSNQDLTFLRNRIRHRLLPLLEAEFNPRVVTALGRVAAVLAAEGALLRRRTRRLEGRLGYRLGPRWACRVDDLARLPVADQRRLLQAAYHRLARRPLPLAHCEAVRALAAPAKEGEPRPWAPEVRPDAAAGPAVGQGARPPGAVPSVEAPPPPPGAPPAEAPPAPPGARPQGEARPEGWPGSTPEPGPEAGRSFEAPVAGRGLDLPGGWRARRQGSWLWLEPQAGGRLRAATPVPGTPGGEEPAQAPAPGEPAPGTARILRVPGAWPLESGLWLRARWLEGDAARQAVARLLAAGPAGPHLPPYPEGRAAAHRANPGPRFLARVICPARAVQGPLILRRPLPGESMQPLGGKGHRSVERIYRTAARRGDLDLVDPATGTGARLGPWVVAAGRDVLWLVGVRAAEGCRVRPKDQRVLLLEVQAGLGPGGGPGGW
ncbi:tRNA lysidine(34) synthetase TilS [Thermaerobacter subterraneus]|uniref:tRNA(Ile)-lysidine synthase n=1 Tax=Thermaerobacter subterraneus DSM 13965 TaxID=867903 RepID=K6P0Q7_9FIRM|nr:tRNA lysidine(34) synthetase TilS [Thermaerobacter subterraneus]EKP94685.1 tRNA(Ile)-lysidine synthetase [Thermaerobacter subterraneus DSM 13965]